MQEITVPFQTGIRDVVLEEVSAEEQNGQVEQGFSSEEVEAIRQQLTDSYEKQILELRTELEQLKPLLIQIEQTTASLGLEQQQRMGEMRELAFELAKVMATHLLKVNLEAGNCAVEKIVEQVLEQLGGSEPVHVYLHPDDLRLLQERLGDELNAFQSERQLLCFEDPTLSRGDCRGEMGDCKVLSQLRTQLETMQEGLLSTLTDCESHVEP